MPFNQNGCSRRQFVGSVASLAAGASLFSSLSPHIVSAAEPARSKRDSAIPKRYRAVSWWLVWEDLTWPTPELMDKVRRRADKCAENGVNCCMLFGAHLRWDFMPLWDRLHEMLHFIAAELHQRDIVLFDHHSSVLTHRPRSEQEALEIWRRNSHHVPFYPSADAAAALRFNGSLLNSWRMLDVQTGQPVYLPAYNAEQYCMNNPDFREAYQAYIRKMIPETGIDGLMSDDGIFYGAWQACGCPHCRKRFNQEFGHKLPPASDLEFWGNRQSKAFRDWIRMRFRTSGDFIAEVKKALAPGFPLLTCSSSSDGYSMPAFGMSYQDFIQSCNLVMLEMTGSTPSLAGTWDERIPSQMLHLGISGKHQVPCLGLGYGYFPDTAFFIWALNKFLGSDCWFSTLKGRLNGTLAEKDALPDDPEVVGEGYRWEKAHPHLFTGRADTQTGVYFSRLTRDLYGQCNEDYCRDYQAGCLSLMRGRVNFEVLTDIADAPRTKNLVLASAICLAPEERKQLRDFMTAGGTLIATGPAGWYGPDLEPTKLSLPEEYGICIERVEPPRPGGFPPYSNLKPPVAIAECRIPEAAKTHAKEGWFEVRVGRGRLLWRPQRISNAAVVAGIVKLLGVPDGDADLQGLPEDWRIRRYRDGKRLLIHALPGKVATVLHNSSLQNAFTRQRIVEKLVYTPLSGTLSLSAPVERLALHSPDLAAPREGTLKDNRWAVELSGVRRYFVLELIGGS